jgi:hypothetical protein
MERTLLPGVIIKTDDFVTKSVKKYVNPCLASLSVICVP